MTEVISEKLCDCGSLEEAKKYKFCFREGQLRNDCKYYVPLVGEGEVQIVKKIKVRRACSLCTLPAAFEINYLYKNARINPKSKAFGRHDDISYCSDDKQFACVEHEKEMYIHPNDKGNWEREFEFCSSFPLKKFPYLGLFWKEEIVKVAPPQ